MVFTPSGKRGSFPIGTSVLTAARAQVHSAGVRHDAFEPVRKGLGRDVARQGAKDGEKDILCRVLGVAASSENRGGAAFDAPAVAFY